MEHRFLLPNDLQGVIFQYLPIDRLKQLHWVLRLPVCYEWHFWAERAYHDFGFPVFLFRQTETKFPEQRHSEIRAYQRDLNASLKEEARSGRVEVIEYLIKRGATKLDRPLREAAASGHLEAVECLVEHGANNLFEALWSAAMHDRVSVVKYLLDREMFDLAQLNGALTEAVDSGSAGAVQLLVHHGATDLDYALLGMAAKGKLDAVKYLINQGARDLVAARRAAEGRDQLEVTAYLKTLTGHQ